MSYLLLLLTIILIWAVVYPVTNYALLSPPSLILLMFAFATLLATIGEAYWNRVEVTPEAYFVILTGCLGVLVAAVVARGLFPDGFRLKSTTKGISAIKKIADIPDRGWYALCLFVVIAAALNIWEMVSMSQAAGFSSTNIMEIAQWARGNVTTLLTSGSEDTESYSALSSALTKIITFCGYAAVIGLSAKIKCKKRRRTDYYSVICLLVLSSAFSLLKGGRDTIAHYVVAFVIVLFAFYIIDSKNRNKTSLQFVKICAIALLITLPLFYFALELVGRLRSVPLLDYISFYLGGGIPSLSYALEHPPVADSMAFPGERTFTQLFALINKIGFDIPVDTYAGAFIKLGNHSSNIYTCFYRYYYDFGFVGVFLFSSLSTLVFCACFQAVEKNPSMPVKIFALYVCSYAADAVREEFIFSRLLSASLLWAIIASLIIGGILMYTKVNAGFQLTRKKDRPHSC